MKNYLTDRPRNLVRLHGTLYTFSAILLVAAVGCSKPSAPVANQNDGNAGEHGAKSFTLIGTWSSSFNYDDVQVEETVSRITGGEEKRQQFRELVNEWESIVTVSEIYANGTFVERDPENGDSVRGTWQIVDETDEFLSVRFRVDESNQEVISRFQVDSNDRIVRIPSAAEIEEEGCAFVDVHIRQ